jgi:uncharacterized protein (TIGR02246 family)
MIDSPERGVREVLQRSMTAFSAGDAEGFAALYARDATVVLTLGVLKGRDEIRAFVAREFAGRLKGATASDDVESIRFVAADTAVAVSLSNFLLPGESEAPAERLRRATCTFTREDGTWVIQAYANTPLPPP